MQSATRNSITAERYTLHCLTYQRCSCHELVPFFDSRWLFHHGTSNIWKLSAQNVQVRPTGPRFEDEFLDLRLKRESGTLKASSRRLYSRKLDLLLISGKLSHLLSRQRKISSLLKLCCLREKWKSLKGITCVNARKNRMAMKRLRETKKAT